jgi:uncharacterized protein (DUF1015 family)
VPEIRPFRALRYDPEVVGDPGRLMAPPYDVISADLRAALAARSPRNVVHIDLPVAEPADPDPDDRYRRAARLYAQWRTDGTLRKDPRPGFYVYEQTYAVPGTSVVRTQRGFLGRLRLEPFGPGAGVLPHERTLSGPKVDRHKLMRATGANLSPVVGLYADPSGRSAAILARVAATPAALDITDDDGVRQRLWVVADTGAGTPVVEELTALAGANPVTIADGHHRYETALRYRDERRVTPSAEADPAFDFVLMLFLESTGEPLTVLATHRVVLGIGDVDATGLVAAAGSLFDVEPMDDGTALAAAFAPAAFAPGGEGRLGLWTRSGGAILRARRESFEPNLPPGGAALRRLDVTLLEITLERLCRIDAAAVASGERIAYAKSSAEAVDAVSGRIGGADAAFLLDPVPVADIIAVAEDGDVMPQKSTYFYPKAVTGLVLNPLEW